MEQSATIVPPTRATTIAATLASGDDLANRRNVCGRPLNGIKLSWPHPSDLRVLGEARRARAEFAPECREADVAKVVRVSSSRELRTDTHLAFELLMNLALECFARGLARLDLTSGELPQAG